jgi:hypothetical protein
MGSTPAREARDYPYIIRYTFPRRRDSADRFHHYIRETPMTWIYNGQTWWEPGPEPSPWLSPGLIFYWLATIVAVVMLTFVFADFFISWAEGQPIVEIVALIAAVTVWFIGRACRWLGA